ncbi:MAG: hypothetical protein UU98_C0030G0012 [Parcubacteria group bacterium GW2011_GWD2_42_14]|nr:MAG: hypothetical protein UU98_C0030G0012 [Parcubacteria group bacterium GW2011_GWD2_42_14]
MMFYSFSNNMLKRDPVKKYFAQREPDTHYVKILLIIARE